MTKRDPKEFAQALYAMNKIHEPLMIPRLMMEPFEDLMNEIEDAVNLLNKHGLLTAEQVLMYGAGIAVKEMKELVDQEDGQDSNSKLQEEV